MVAIVGAVSVFYPLGKTRCFIIQKDTAIGYGRLSVRVLSGFNIYVGLFHDGNICPPIPGRYSHLFGKFVDTINSTTSVAADDNYRFIYSLTRIGDDLQDIFFIFPIQFLFVYFSCRHQLLYKRSAISTCNDTLF